MLRVPRTRGVASGVLLILLGAWGALIPFIGPYFHFAYTPDTAWAYTTGRLWLQVIPGVATLIGGLILLVSTFRPAAIVGACLAAAGGAWFALGTLFAPLWPDNGVPVPAALHPGVPVGGPIRMMTEHLTFFTGLGVVIVFIAAFALGRLAVIGARDVEVAASRVAPEQEPVMAGTAPATERVSRRRSAAATEADGGQRTGMFHRLTSARSSSSGAGSEES